jgi:hypothetical protein
LAKSTLPGVISTLEITILKSSHFAREISHQPGNANCAVAKLCSAVTPYQAGNERLWSAKAKGIAQAPSPFLPPRLLDEELI